jgi:5,10-methylenetetrahydrofolate reductase
MNTTRLHDILAQDTFAVTAEIGPPKGADAQQMYAHIDLLTQRVHGINVTDNQSAVMRMSSLGACAEIARRGGEAILQLTCRDRNRIALQSDLLAAGMLGIHNVVCLSGDHPCKGDHPDAMGVFDFDSVHLMQAVARLNQGVDFGGNALDSPTSLYCGGVITPDADPLEPQLMKFEKKVQAGMRFVQTQAVFDMDRFAAVMQRLRKIAPETKVLAGILLLSSPGMARYVDTNIPGISVPPALHSRLQNAKKGTRLETGMDIAAELIHECKERTLCDGVHIMAINKEARVPDILRRAGL